MIIYHNFLHGPHFDSHSSKCLLLEMPFHAFPPIDIRISHKTFHDQVCWIKGLSFLITTVTVFSAVWLWTTWKPGRNRTLFSTVLPMPGQGLDGNDIQSNSKQRSLTLWIFSLFSRTQKYFYSNFFLDQSHSTTFKKTTGSVKLLLTISGPEWNRKLIVSLTENKDRLLEK